MRRTILGLIVFCVSGFAFADSDGVLVKIRPQLQAAESQALGQAMIAIGAKVERNYQLVEGLLHIRGKADLSDTQVVSILAKTPGVEYAELNFRRQLVSKDHYSPNLLVRADPPVPAKTEKGPWKKDKKWASQYGVSQNFTRDVFKKYNFYGSPKVVIAVIDTGVDYTHRDLANNMWRNKAEVPDNGIDDDNNGYIDDYVGYDFANKDALPYDDHAHGTHVAGIAAAIEGNGEDIVGQCPNCSIMGLKFITAEGSGTDADAISALEYAAKMGADITNNSWGGTEYSKPLEDAFKAAGEAGMINIVAAGNEGQDITFNQFFPARFVFPTLLTVAALYETQNMIPFWSNYSSSFVHVDSGGHEVTSTIPGNKTASFSGTSMAAPQVAGCVGMIKSYNRELPNATIIDLIKKNVQPNKDSGKTKWHGRPHMLNIFKAIQKG